MTFELQKSIEILCRTPQVLQAQLSGLSNDWIVGNEGPGTWSPFDVVGHLIVCEETNFLPRTLFMLAEGENKLLDSIDMTAHLNRNDGKSMNDLLDEFSQVRKGNIEKLESLALTEQDFKKTAIHPTIGTVCVANVLSTWVAHDLIHLVQINRVMAKQYKEEIGHFIHFLTRLQ
jgi:hypothetical protein